MQSGEITTIFGTRVTLDAETVGRVSNMIEVFEDDDDVQQVYNNHELTDEVMARLKQGGEGSGFDLNAGESAGDVVAKVENLIESRHQKDAPHAGIDRAQPQLAAVLTEHVLAELQQLRDV